MEIFTIRPLAAIDVSKENEYTLLEYSNSEKKYLILIYLSEWYRYNRDIDIVSVNTKYMILKFHQCHSILKRINRQLDLPLLLYGGKYMNSLEMRVIFIFQILVSQTSREYSQR